MRKIHDNPSYWVGMLAALSFFLAACSIIVGIYLLIQIHSLQLNTNMLVGQNLVSAEKNRHLVEHIEAQLNRIEAKAGASQSLICSISRQVKIDTPYVIKYCQGVN